jgi:caffeoyl-CoA O-methyltransferase
VTLVTGPALETLAGIDGPFDFAYIDADKGSYPQYLDAVVERLRPGGVVALDNLLWLGQAAHEPEDSDFHRESTPIIRAFNEAFLADARLDSTIVQVGDGVGLGVKRPPVDG